MKWNYISGNVLKISDEPDVIRAWLIAWLFDCSTAKEGKK